ncbi:MAG TPA: metal ABC transporter ATP-binding protein [Clostridiales bacterium]|jgi:zinc transport system ATP-binding protein|nr:metal ABC transporter ATP-binding protein [Clostridiales bacterium]
MLSSFNSEYENYRLKAYKHKDNDSACGLHCIKINDISVKVGEQTIIDKVNLHIHCGKVTTIIGRNGAGKTTLIRAILGEIKHSGSIEFMDLKDKTKGDLKIGYVPQNVNIEKNTPMSVYDLFAGYVSNAPVFFRKNKKTYEMIKNQLSIFDAQDLIDKRACDLSGGELQRVLLSIAVTPVPNLLLLDEPVSGIDRKGMEFFYKNIKYLKENYDLAMIVVSHDFEFVRKYSDHVILLDRTILKEGSFEDVRQSEEFKRVFGGGPDGFII